MGVAPLCVPWASRSCPAALGPPLLPHWRMPQLTKESALDLAGGYRGRGSQGSLGSPLVLLAPPGSPVPPPSLQWNSSGIYEPIFSSIKYMQVPPPKHGMGARDGARAGGTQGHLHPCWGGTSQSGPYPCWAGLGRSGSYIYPVSLWSL